MKYFKNKRGLALENAILFMVIIFSLCALLTTFAVIGNRRAKIAKETFLERVATEQILEDVLAAGSLAERYEVGGAVYVCTLTTKNEIRTLSIYKMVDEEEVLKRTVTLPSLPSQ